jgi:hypothetical protein
MTLKKDTVCSSETSYFTGLNYTVQNTKDGHHMKDNRPFNLNTNTQLGVA